MAAMGKVYVVMHPNMLANYTIQQPSQITFRTQKSRPESRLDLRKKRGIDLDGVMKELRDYYARRAQWPTAIRLHRKDKHALTGSVRGKTRLFGFKVTL